MQAEAPGHGEDRSGLPETPTIRIRPGRRAWACFEEVWAYRELLYFLVWRDLKVRYKQTAIGVGWVLIQPFLTMIAFTVFFGVLAKIPSDDTPYPIFYYSALLPWIYFSSALSGATTTMVDHRTMITKVYFPRLLLPVSAIISPLVDFAIAFSLLIGMMVYYDVVLTATAWLFPLFLLLAASTALGVGLWLSALNAVYRDVRYAVPFLIQVWMLASPVAYPSSLIPETWRWIFGLNPMAGVIEGFRWVLLGRGQPPGFLLFASLGAVGLILVGGAIYFHRMEATIADVI
jgi:lipopolysaccharide transport system permease protein